MTITFVEFKAFKKFADENLDAEVLRQLQNELILNPNKGDLIRGTGGARKLRFAGKGKGKSGGFRVIYYTEPPFIFFLIAYSKDKKDNLSEEQKKLIKKLIKGE